MKVKLLFAQSCLTLCNALDYSLPGSPIHGILQARILEWAAVPPPGYLPNPGIELTSVTFPVLAGGFFTTSTTWEAPYFFVSPVCFVLGCLWSYYWFLEVYIIFLILLDIYVYCEYFLKILFTSTSSSVFYLFAYLVALSLHCCARPFSSCGERELLFIVVHGLPIAVASLVVEHRPQSTQASVVAVGAF